MIRILILVFTCMIAGWTSPAWAQGKVTITSDRFVVNEGQNQAMFEGNVEVTQPDLSVSADKIIVHYGASAGDIKDMEAIGHVRLKTAEQNVTGDRGVYDPDTRIMHLYGNVVVINAQGRVTGPELLANLKTNTIEFVSQKNTRVTGVFSP